VHRSNCPCEYNGHLLLDRPQFQVIVNYQPDTGTVHLDRCALLFERSGFGYFPARREITRRNNDVETRGGVLGAIECDIRRHFLEIARAEQEGAARHDDTRHGVILTESWIFRASGSYLGAIVPGTGDDLGGLVLQAGIGKMFD
jgi:hypothetical protein